MGTVFKGGYNIEEIYANNVLVTDLIKRLGAFTKQSKEKVYPEKCHEIWLSCTSVTSICHKDDMNREDNQTTCKVVATVCHTLACLRRLARNNGYKCVTPKMKRVTHHRFSNSDEVLLVGKCRLTTKE
ncbi:hypothetical protein BaRGS_00009028 [Batillaria attramentaria]|uniref:Uncharacterized protein n=1 Tax=Batillaria attramentaria TaxID=370345 RepID=A0ABD0LK70_9CAEN